MNRSGNKLPPSLAWIPWWLSVIMAIVSYVGLKHLAPDLAISAGFIPLARFLPQIAPLAAIGFLLLAATLLYDGDDSQSGEPPGEPDDNETDEQEH